MNAKQLIDIARRADDGLSYEEQGILGQHILSTVRPDDDEPVTVEWVDAETPLVNRSTSPYSRNYLIRGGVRLAASAKPGGFEPCVLWCGSANEFYEVGTPTRGDVRALLRGLRVPFNK